MACAGKIVTCHIVLKDVMHTHTHMRTRTGAHAHTHMDARACAHTHTARVERLSQTDGRTKHSVSKMLIIVEGSLGI